MGQVVAAPLGAGQGPLVSRSVQTTRAGPPARSWWKMFQASRTGCPLMVAVKRIGVNPSPPVLAMVPKGAGSGVARPVAGEVSRGLVACTTLVAVPGSVVVNVAPLSVDHCLVKPGGAWSEPGT